jgi:type III secretion system FlhB-like substrate exporter
MTKTESKKKVHELYEKYYGEGKKKTAKGEGPKRAELITQAKEKGIKNFRILNREELMKVLAPDVTKESIAEVVQAAVTRWKSGWGNRGGRPVTQKA